jgi:hypothetical protein
MATFLPDKQTLEQLKSLLKDVHVGDNEVQKRVFRVGFRSS